MTSIIYFHAYNYLLTLHRDCPDECKEAVPSLMYAAARISDLPELRDLRTLFTEKFGNSLEPYTCKEVNQWSKKPNLLLNTKICFDFFWAYIFVFYA